MKTSVGVLAATLMLSAIIWAVFYAFMPGPALTPAETLVVVGMCLGVVSASRWVWSSLRRARGGQTQNR
ncbi:MAG TPA: hypothetical protein VLG48_03825 [Candidatus Methylomirabilis sp.]|nr:hypothetical protein [Candidatus Methylomirabilis sp.]